MEKEEYFKELNELIEIPIFVDDNNVSAEAENNLCSIGIDPETAILCNEEDFSHFINKVMVNRRAQLPKGKHMLFYVWLDEMAGQLRFSLVSAKNKRPPFASEIKLATLGEIIREFLTSINMEGIPEEEFEEPDDSAAPEAEKPFAQNIYIAVI